MPLRKIGSLSVSIVGLGCNNFGGRTDEAQSARVIFAALDAGINFFDTADVYAGTLSEQIVGRALANRRDEVVIATKFGMELSPQEHGAAPAYVKSAIEDSLRRLGTDYVDLYQLHKPDAATPISDTLGALAQLVTEGKVREIGCSNFSALQLQEAEQATAPGAPGFVSVQNEYSLLQREPEVEVLAECERQALAFIPFFPLKMGLLSGKFRFGQPPPPGTRIAGMPAERQRELLGENAMGLLQKLEDYATGRGHTLLELATGWLLAKPTVCSVISGATRPEQVSANAKAATWVLTPQEVAEVDAIAPPPGTGPFAP